MVDNLTQFNQKLKRAVLQKHLIGVFYCALAVLNFATATSIKAWTKSFTEFQYPLSIIAMKKTFRKKILRTSDMLHEKAWSENKILRFMHGQTKLSQSNEIHFFLLAVKLPLWITNLCHISLSKFRAFRRGSDARRNLHSNNFKF